MFRLEVSSGSQHTPLMYIADTAQRPVVIPRIDIARPFAVQLPFMRAYSPALYRHDISVETFVAFIDNLAVAEAAPVPLQALNVAGQAIGFV